MSTDSSEVRRRAWQTRRARYGERGHGTAYRQAARCPRCRELEAEVARLLGFFENQRLAETVSRETVAEEHG